MEEARFDCCRYAVSPKKGDYCTALKELNCNGCSFYKSTEEKLLDDERTRNRLKSINWKGEK